MKQKLGCILLIDDDEANNFLSNMIIEDVDCAITIKTKQTGNAALNYLIESNRLSSHNTTLPIPDLIFLDINMPAMDGWEFLGKYKEIISNVPNTPTPVIVMLSTSVNPEDKIKALSIPEVSEFQSKPMTPEMIYTIMDKYFPQHI